MSAFIPTPSEHAEAARQEAEADARADAEAAARATRHTSTPGPWTYDKNYACVRAGETKLAELVGGHSPALEGCGSCADGRMMAAAPDLLGALSDLVALIDDRAAAGKSIWSDDLTGSVSLAFARLAIAKAEGRDV